MDFSDPKVWIDGWAVAMKAPHIVWPLVFTAAGAAWWLRSTIGKGAKDTLEQRLQLAREREEDVTQKREEQEKRYQDLEKRYQELKTQIAAGASKERLVEASTKVDTALQNFATANNALASAISEPVFRPWEDAVDRSGTPLPMRKGEKQAR